MTREVWQWADEGTFRIYAESGGVQGALLYTGSFVRRVTIRRAYEVVIVEEPTVGRAKKSWLKDVDVACERALLRKATDFPATIHVDGSQYQIAIVLVNSRYSGVAPEENDTFTATGCVPVSDDFSWPELGDALLNFAFSGTGQT